MSQRQVQVVPKTVVPLSVGRLRLLRVNQASIHPTLLNSETSGKFRKRKTRFILF